MNLSQVIANKFHISLQYPAHVDSQWYSIPCPLHSDTNASAGLNFELKLFNCFGGCGTLNFKHLAEKLELSYSIDDEPLQFDEETDWQALLIGSTPKKMTLKKQAAEYTAFLLEKQIKPETIEEFGGYYEANQASQDYGYLIIPYGKDKRERRRIIKSIGDNRFEQRKGASKALFGRQIASYDSIILVEGITDYLTLWQAGLHNIAATFGAEVSKQQMYKLRGKTVFILFDRDYAGFEGSKKALNYLREFGAIPIILEIPKWFGEDDEKIDPNSAYIHSGSMFIDWIRSQTERYSLFDSKYISNIFLENKRTVKYVSTGIQGLDNCLNGGFATGLHAIAGMPEAGKSTLITHLEDTFVAQGQSVLSLSYELTKEQKYARLASREAYILWSEIEKDHSVLGRFDSKPNRYLIEISQKLRIDNNWNIEEVKAAAPNFDIIIVDYIQRMPFEDSDERAGIKQNARELSNLTRDGKIVILISSIPRSMYDKTGKNVFKETGDIEYICQSGYILNKINKDTACLSMIKNTRGESKDIFLTMDYAHQRVNETVQPDISEMMK